MRSKTILLISAVAALGAAAFAPSAWAQAAPQGPAHGQRGDMRARMEAMRQAHEAQRAQDLRTILRLRPDQEPALTAFLASHKRPERPMGGPEAGGRRGAPGVAPAPLTTAQRLDMEDRRMAEMSARRQQHETALRTFYAALSPEQKQVFDALQRAQHGGGHGHHRGFGGPGFAWRGGPHGGPPGGPPPRGDE